MKDALGNDVVVGNVYGYSQQSSGVVTIVIGTVDKADGKKVTLRDVKERRGVWGEIEKPFVAQDRKRSVHACHLFPVTIK